MWHPQIHYRIAVNKPSFYIMYNNAQVFNVARFEPMQQTFWDIVHLTIKGARPSLSFLIFIVFHIF